MSRQALIETLSTAVLAALGEQPVDVFTENGPEPDFANQQRAFVVFEIAIDKRSKVGLGDAPSRLTGAVQFGIFERVGQGTGATIAVQDALDAALSNRYIGAVLVNGSQSFPPQRFGQWNPAGVQYLFTFDDIPENTIPDGAMVSFDGTYLVDNNGQYIVGFPA